VDFVFQIDVAGVVDIQKRLEDGADGHDSLAHGDLGLAAGGIGEVLDVEVVEARAGGVDGGDHVGAGADGVAEVDAEADARIHVLDGGEHVEGRGKVLVLGAVVVDGELDVVLLDELFQARKVLVGGRADGDGDARGLEVFELGTDVGVVVLVEGDVAVRR
jgi:hypothetical protein